MTKKDYQLIAKVFNTTAEIWIDTILKWQASDKPDKEEKIDNINKILASIDVIVKGLCHELKINNPKFDPVRFCEACGIPAIKESKTYILN